MGFSLGFAKPGPTAPFGHPGSFGHPGAGESFGFADPQTDIGYAYVTNRMGTSLPFDPRDVALRAAMAIACTELRSDLRSPSLEGSSTAQYFPLIKTLASARRC
jgi:CubicO group peptidase (beta-lactamase class C family)